MSFALKRGKRENTASAPPSPLEKNHLQGALTSQKATPSFARGLNLYKLFWVFFICCFLGVIVETIWCLLKHHTIESRAGVIYGPFNPVYGFGAVAMTLVLERLKTRRDSWIFVGGMAIGGVFEWFCSFFQEAAFGTVSWEYSGTLFSLAGGRTNLVYMLFWGILCLLWVKILFPLLSSYIEKIPNRFGVALSWVLAVLLILDMGISCLAVDRQSERRSGETAQNRLDHFLDRAYPDEYLEKVYPNMMAVSSQE